MRHTSYYFVHGKWQVLTLAFLCKNLDYKPQSTNQSKKKSIMENGVRLHTLHQNDKNI